MAYIIVHFSYYVNCYYESEPSDIRTDTTTYFSGKRNILTKLTPPRSTKMDSNFLLLPYLCDGLNALSWGRGGGGEENVMENKKEKERYIK